MMFVIWNRFNGQWSNDVLLDLTTHSRAMVPPCCRSGTEGPSSPNYTVPKKDRPQPTSSLCIGPSTFVFHPTISISWCNTADVIDRKHYSPSLSAMSFRLVEPDCFQRQSDEFMRWLAQTPGVRINPKITVVDLRSQGSGRGVGMSSPFLVILFVEIHDPNSNKPCSCSRTLQHIWRRRVICYPPQSRTFSEQFQT